MSVEQCRHQHRSPAALLRSSRKDIVTPSDSPTLSGNGLLVPVSGPLLPSSSCSCLMSIRKVTGSSDLPRTDAAFLLSTANTNPQPSSKGPPERCLARTTGHEGPIASTVRPPPVVATEDAPPAASAREAAAEELLPGARKRPAPVAHLQAVPQGGRLLRPIVSTSSRACARASLAQHPTEPACLWMTSSFRER